METYTAIFFTGAILMAVNAVSSLDGALRRGVTAKWPQIGALCAAVVVGFLFMRGMNSSSAIFIVCAVLSVASVVSYLAGTAWGKGMRSRSTATKFLPPIVGSAFLLMTGLSGIFFMSRGSENTAPQSTLTAVLFMAASLAWLADNVIEARHDNDTIVTFIFSVYAGMVVCVLGIIRPDLAVSPTFVALGIAMFVGLPWLMGWFANRKKRDLFKKVRDGIQALREGREPDMFVAKAGGEARDIAEAVGTLMWAVRSNQDELRNKLMELEELDRARREFLQNISHELRTPLMGVIGHADLLLAINAQKGRRVNGGDASEPDDEVRFISTIKEQGRRLLSMITDLLEYSRAEVGQLKVFPRTVDIGGILAEVGRSCKAYARRNQLEIMFDTREAFVNADPAKIRQALSHVVDNALKFTPKGGRVRLKVIPAQSEKGTVEIAIEDTGMGIPPEALARLFKGFRQGDGSASREFGGLGIGLSLSRSLIEAHGGKMEVESNPGKGTRVLINLRAAASPPGTPDIPEIVSGHLVLLFSPDHALGELVRDQLRHTSLSVGLVYRRADLLDVIRKKSPRALLLSVTDTDLNGGGLYENLQGNPITAPIPKILIMDGSNGVGATKGCETLDTPFDREQLVGAIKHCLNARVQARDSTPLSGN